MAWLGRVDLFFRSAGCAVGNYKLPQSYRTTARYRLGVHSIGHLGMAASISAIRRMVSLKAVTTLQ
jgi:hypothetical protein